MLILVTLGGFTTNFIWCLFLIIKNRRAGQFFGHMGAEPMPRSLGAAAAEPAAPAVLMDDAQPEARGIATASGERVPLLGNYCFAALAGILWYLQFFFYSMGQTKMGKYDFSSWTLHMASIIIFSTLWGISFREWNGTRRTTKVLVALGLLMLVLSTAIIGYGNYLKVGVSGN